MFLINTIKPLIFCPKYGVLYTFGRFFFFFFAYIRNLLYLCRRKIQCVTLHNKAISRRFLYPAYFRGIFCAFNQNNKMGWGLAGCAILCGMRGRMALYSAKRVFPTSGNSCMVIVTSYSIVHRWVAPIWQNRTTFYRGLWDLRRWDRRCRRYTRIGHVRGQTA